MSVSPRAIVPSVNGWSGEYLEAQYLQFKADPASVPGDLQAFFQGFDLAQAHPPLAGGSEAGRSTGTTGGELAEALRLQSAATNLIDSYRRRGHLTAQIDPFGRERARPSNLTLKYHGLSETDLDKAVNVGSLPLPAAATLRQVIDLLERTYCGPIGAEIMHVSADEERMWLAERCERARGSFDLSRPEKAHILETLVKSEQFETFLQKRYPGEKRFSLEGSESLIPLLDRIIEAGSQLGVEEIVLGMPHRGRLNVLNNILGKTYEQIFTEFEDNWDPDFADGGGDVKYHRGYSGERALRSGKTVHLACASNPSHLESVDGVVLGRCRAKQRLRGDTVERRRVIPLLIHGDAAVIGQGVVAEALNLSQLQGYTCGGCIHVVINNLIGFTTGPEDARTSRYCTDLGQMIETPVFHVNGEDPEAVVTAAQIAAEYRQRFRKDVFIDLYCYRKYGHNEQDEPSFTQPVLASLIRAKPGVLSVYAERLRAQGVITEADLKAIADRLNETLEKAQQSAKARPKGPNIEPGSRRWKGFDREYSFGPFTTSVSEDLIREVCDGLGRVPEGFNLNPKLKALLEDRRSLPTTRKISYADAETLAYGTLLLEGHGVRLSGQDARRGTFSHRHAVLRDYQSGEPYTPLNNMRPIPDLPGDAGKTGADGRPTQGRLCVYDSPLSEMAVLAFDYGYSLADPGMLVLWEAQFGDFCNGAQTIIDQYIASAEIKWQRWSGLCMLLPHGYEGAGPEHSSCRLERFLLLCANNNMQVVYPSTAAQTFHMLRRQLKQPFRKPLIVLTPKSVLRLATSTIDDLTANGAAFQCILDDPLFTGSSLGGPAAADRGKVQRVIICSGKIFHELAARREALKRTDVAMIRVEQLYPFHHEQFAKVLAQYPKDVERVWVQEEPRNAGAYLHIADLLRTEHGIDLPFLGRAASATPAVGSKHAHKDEQEALISAAIGPAPGPAPGSPTKEVNGASKANGTHAGRTVRIPAKR